MDGGLGFADFLMSMPCLVIAPGFGWKIKFGRTPVCLNLGFRSESFVPLGDNKLKYQTSDDELGEFRPFNIGMRLDLGFSF